MLDRSWSRLLKDEYSKPYFVKMEKFIQGEYGTGTVFPPYDLIFNAFNQCPFEKLKVVILGQDPYHDDGQAHGLCFSVPTGIKKPPSLRNIFIELKQDLDITNVSTDLTPWARQGVLLLNTCLTVEAHKPMSHAHTGWSIFTNKVIEQISRNNRPIIFLLWGRQAQRKESFIADGNYILKANHPSPLSAEDFFGCKHFSQVNKLLQGFLNKDPVDWRTYP